MPVITGYPAKYLCSAIFTSERKQADVENLDLHFSFIQYVTNKVNYKERSVTSTFLWGKSKAIYRDGFGATLLNQSSDEQKLRAIKFPESIHPTYNPDTTLWPLGEIVPPIHPTEKFKNLKEQVIEKDAYGGNIFAFVILHKGLPVVEGYKSGFNSKTRLLGWSMAKSFTNTLAGTMVQKGLIDERKPTGLIAWENDERKNITLDDLMRMQSGLQWNEGYGSRTDVTSMLYAERDFAQYAFSKPKEQKPGDKWLYSSGSTNIVNYVMRQQFDNDDAYYKYSYQALFNKIGMSRAILEVDPTGTQVGSSYIYASARDYARYALLHLQNGEFNGQQILPTNWIKKITTPTKDSNGVYGSCFWLNKSKYLKDVPTDAYSCNGHDGQRIFIIPSLDLAVVILGYSPKPNNVIDYNSLLKDVIDSI
jgi:CubicO group peptidase (beta-lactamase class C family)